MIIIIGISGCSRNDEAVINNSEYIMAEESTSDTVQLSEIIPPKFREDFATLSYEDQSDVLFWGDSTIDSDVVWAKSGYPGFDYPIIITTKTDITAKTVSIYVSWGMYTYSKISSGVAFKENKNLIDKETGKALVNYSKASEYLLLWCEKTKCYTMYLKTGGTEIVI